MNLNEKDSESLKNLLLWRSLGSLEDVAIPKLQTAYYNIIDDLCNQSKIPSPYSIIEMLYSIQYTEPNEVNFSIESAMSQERADILLQKLYKLNVYNVNELIRVSRKNDVRKLLLGLIQFLAHGRIPILSFCLDPDKYYNKDCGLFYCYITDSHCH